MIIIEFLWYLIKFLFYYITRPFIWLITARDCKHCKHAAFNHQGYCFCNGVGVDEDECKSTSWRCNFKRSCWVKW